MLSDKECNQVIDKIIEESKPLAELLKKCKTHEEKTRTVMMWALKKKRVSLPVKEVQVPVEVIKKVEVPVEIVKEIEVPVEVIKTVPVEVVKYVDREVVKEVEVIKEVDMTD